MLPKKLMGLKREYVAKFSNPFNRTQLNKHQLRMLKYISEGYNEAKLWEYLVSDVAKDKLIDYETIKKNDKYSYTVRKENYIYKSLPLEKITLWEKVQDLDFEPMLEKRSIMYPGYGEVKTKFIGPTLKKYFDMKEKISNDVKISILRQIIVNSLKLWEKGILHLKPDLDHWVLDLKNLKVNLIGPFYLTDEISKENIKYNVIALLNIIDFLSPDKVKLKNYILHKATSFFGDKI